MSLTLRPPGCHSLSFADSGCDSAKESRAAEAQPSQQTSPSPQNRLRDLSQPEHKGGRGLHLGEATGDQVQALGQTAAPGRAIRRERGEGKPGLQLSLHISRHSEIVSGDQHHHRGKEKEDYDKLSTPPHLPGTHTADDLGNQVRNQMSV
ncbi:hypothetical protein E5288_WYG010393 [Bos mutus]|uniref:Uncharacterized protein n=1 Tax=Bos mutus TaxID=72004 RepID=A0A6B0S2H4_9CETA|nr:hypothetical protein [Bos mutus]